MDKKESPQPSHDWTGYSLQRLHTDPRPEPRQGHVMVELTSGEQGRYFLFGGRGSTKVKPWKEMSKEERQRGKKKKPRRYLSDAWILDLQERVWRQIDDTNSTSRPCARWSAAGFLYEDAVYIHGGRSLDHFLDDLWKYDREKGVWQRVEMHGQTPPPVNGHSLVLYDKTIVLFGGSYSMGRDRNYNGDTYALDLRQFKWKKLSCNPRPSPRYWQSTVSNGRFWYLVGGFAFTDDGEESYSDEVWMFDLEQYKWTQVQLPDGSFHRRNRCGVETIDPSRLVIFGGNYFGSHRRDIFLSSVSLLNADDRTVTELSCVEGAPLGVSHQTFLRIKGSPSPSFLVFGGEDGTQRFNDIFILSLVRDQVSISSSGEKASAVSG